MLQQNRVMGRESGFSLVDSHFPVRPSNPYINTGTDNGTDSDGEDPDLSPPALRGVFRSPVPLKSPMPWLLSGVMIAHDPLNIQIKFAALCEIIYIVLNPEIECDLHRQNHSKLLHNLKQLRRMVVVSNGTLSGTPLSRTLDELLGFASDMRCQGKQLLSLLEHERLTCVHESTYGALSPLCIYNLTEKDCSAEESYNPQEDPGIYTRNTFIAIIKKIRKSTLEEIKSVKQREITVGAGQSDVDLGSLLDHMQDEDLKKVVTTRILGLFAKDILLRSVDEGFSSYNQKSNAKALHCTTRKNMINLLVLAMQAGLTGGFSGMEITVFNIVGAMEKDMSPFWKTLVYALMVVPAIISLFVNVYFADIVVRPVDFLGLSVIKKQYAASIQEAKIEYDGDLYKDLKILKKQLLMALNLLLNIICTLFSALAYFYTAYSGLMLISPSMEYLWIGVGFLQYLFRDYQVFFSLKNPFDYLYPYKCFYRAIRNLPHNLLTTKCDAMALYEFMRHMTAPLYVLFNLDVCDRFLRSITSTPVRGMWDVDAIFLLKISSFAVLYQTIHKWSEYKLRYADRSYKATNLGWAVLTILSGLATVFYKGEHQEVDDCSMGDVLLMSLFEGWQLHTEVKLIVTSIPIVMMNMSAFNEFMKTIMLVELATDLYKSVLLKICHENNLQFEITCKAQQTKCFYNAAIRVWWLTQSICWQLKQLKSLCCYSENMLLERPKRLSPNVTIVLDSYCCDLSHEPTPPISLIKYIKYFDCFFSAIQGDRLLPESYGPILAIIYCLHGDLRADGYNEEADILADRLKIIIELSPGAEVLQAHFRRQRKQDNCRGLPPPRGGLFAGRGDGNGNDNDDGRGNGHVTELYSVVDDEDALTAPLCRNI